MTVLHLSMSLTGTDSFRLESKIGKKSNRAISHPLVLTDPDFSEYDSSKED